MVSNAFGIRHARIGAQLNIFSTLEINEFGSVNREDISSGISPSKHLVRVVCAVMAEELEESFRFMNLKGVFWKMLQQYLMRTTLLRVVCAVAVFVTKAKIFGEEVVIEGGSWWKG